MMELRISITNLNGVVTTKHDLNPTGWLGDYLPPIDLIDRMAEGGQITITAKVVNLDIESLGPCLVHVEGSLICGKDQPCEDHS